MSGFNPDEPRAEDGPMNRGLLPVLTAFRGQHESENYAERCYSVPPNE